MQVLDYSSPHGKQPSKLKQISEDFETSDCDNEDEGYINKQVLISIGSMAQLKHPR